MSDIKKDIKEKIQYFSKEEWYTLLEKRLRGEINIEVGGVLLPLLESKFGETSIDLFIDIIPTLGKEYWNNAYLSVISLFMDEIDKLGEVESKADVEVTLDNIASMLLLIKNLFVRPCEGCLNKEEESDVMYMDVKKLEFLINNKFYVNKYLLSLVSLLDDIDIISFDVVYINKIIGLINKESYDENLEFCEDCILDLEYWLGGDV